MQEDTNPLIVFRSNDSMVSINYFPVSGNLYISIHKVSKELCNSIQGRAGTESDYHNGSRTLDLSGGKIEVTLFEELSKKEVDN